MLKLKWILPILLALASSACALQTPAPRFHAEAARAFATAAAQVKRCYRAPRVSSHEGRQIVTRLRVRFGPDGTVAEMPSIVAQIGVTPDNQGYAGPMAEAAIASVLRCSPLSLPPELYSHGWDEFELTFSPSAFA